LKLSARQSSKKIEPKFIFQLKEKIDLLKNQLKKKLNLPLMGCLKLTYEPVLKVITRTEQNTLSREGKSRAGLYKYKYNSKEFQDELGLNWYDYGWINYDPAISRWVSVDPLLNDLKFTFDDSKIDEEDEDEIFEALVTKLETGDGIFNVDNLNPYGYGYNNPISFDDPDGRCPVCLYVIAALLYSEFANAPTGNAQTDSRNYEASKENKTIVSETVIKRGGNLRGTTGTVPGKTPGITPKKEKSTEKTYQTYTKKNEKTGETYSGRTSGTGTPKENVAKRDATHHKNKEGYGPAKIDKTTKSKDAARGREQQLIDKNGKAKSEGGTSGNSVRGVSEKNPNAKKYEEAAKKEFGN
jgi:hypothetical protein